jgi:hypothetical protein
MFYSYWQMCSLAVAKAVPKRCQEAAHHQAVGPLVPGDWRH